MRFVRHPERVVAVLLAAAAAGCGGDGSSITGPTVSTAPNQIRLESDANDYIGAGHTYTYSQANAIITVTATRGRFSIVVDGDELWAGNFQLPSGINQLQPGMYNSLERYPFHDPAKGGLSWSGDGRGCNTLSGWFAIDAVMYEAGELTGIDLRFEQHCEGAPAALRGTIHWRSDDRTTAPGPVNPVPAGLWRPAAGSTPASGNYIYLKSDVGDYIGAGLTYTYTPANASIGITTNGGLLSVDVNGAEWWFGDFETMNTLSQLQPGYYADLRRYPFHNRLKGGLSWGGEGRGCNTLRGWFAIDRVTYSGGNLTGLDLRFEQRCEGGTTALHGAIHWDA